MSNLSKSMFINEAAYQEALAEERGTTKAQHFLMKAALYFEQRPTKGEDSAHWANVYNAKNCREVAEQYGYLLEALHECAEYFDRFADAEFTQDGPNPNVEMTLLQSVTRAIDKAEGR
ncbi:hypothetical protein [Nitratireductor basaltis]|uniref:Uncharacterized protein n=1 Tax=Nitratireductor basaltis TaxID=472175 RepID=A0A084UDM4_9HYPH|nr:hypothetical protein [Nitratireductor basaltis]KFB11060.1 hypothetical protein EL18_02102 [Nitratireductor basaltis]